VIRAAGVAAAFVACGCATIQKERGHREVAALVEERVGRKTRWESGTPEDAAIRKHVDEALANGLTSDEAVEIALLNSPRLQRTYEELGVSQADLVQAALLPNPSLGLDVGFPIRAGAGETEVAASLAEDLLAVLVLPLRRAVAEEQFAADVLRVADEALEFAAEVDKQYREVQAREKLVALRTTVVQGESAAADLARRLHEAGNITDLELASEQVVFEVARIQLAREELELVDARERLNRLLGLWGAQTEWKLAQELPEIPPSDPSLDGLEALAIRQRLDIDAARKQRALMWKALELARTTRWFGRLEVGIEGHQDPDGPRLLGPTLSLELPIFDQRQALIARLEAQFRQSERRLDELSVSARSEVRTAAARLASLRRTVDQYRKAVLPLRERVLEQSQLQYNAMQIGLFQLVVAKQQQVEAYGAYLEAIRDYWQERAQLARLVGGRLAKAAEVPQR
jgi:outer membrane protein, heavy metal efflux system